MVTVSQIINEAYRETNLIPIGQSPSAVEQAEAVLIFNRLVKAVFGNEAGDPYTNFGIGNNNVVPGTIQSYDTIPTNNWYPPTNSRIIFNNTSTQTLNLNPAPIDGERLSIQDASNNFSTLPLTVVGNGRTIDGATSVSLNTNGLVQEWFYRADVHDWRTISNLTADSVLPFPVEFEDLFIIGLALRLNPRNGTQIDPQSISTYNKLQSKFRARYSLVIQQSPELALLRTSGVPYQIYRNIGRYMTTTQLFNSGNPY